MILFIYKSLYGEQITYCLPDQHSRFLHELHQHFKTSSTITIISPSFHHSEFKKELQNVAKHGCTVSLILNNLRGDPLSMVQYQYLNLYHTSLPINQSTIFVDNTLVCTLSTPIDEERFMLEHTSVQCSNAQDVIQSIRHTLKPVMLRSEPYLK
jgi:predicted transcriptional regulator